MVNNPASALTNIMKNAQSFIKQLESGEGFNIPEDKKEEFQKMMKEKGVPDLVTQLKDKMKEFKDISKKMHNGSN